MIRWLLTFTGIPPISVTSSLSMASLKARRALLRDGLPPDLEVHIVAVTPAAVGAAGLIGEGGAVCPQACTEAGTSIGTRSRWRAPGAST